ncbi:MAG: isoprenylcysteine carboxylmethyltransferase family protein [Candidatus Thorarchaeota archaeon]
MMDIDLIFKIILIIIYSLFSILRVYFSRKARKTHKDSSIKENKIRLTFLQSYIIITVILFFLFVFLPEWFVWGTIPNYPEGIRWFGVGLGVLSLIFFTIVHIFLGTNFSYTLRLSEEHQLITSGPYRFIRHPMYSAFILLHISIFLVTKNWFFGIIWIGGLLIVIALRISKEEEMLIGRFGKDYENYIKRTGSLFFPVFKFMRKETRNTIINGYWSYHALSDISNQEINQNDIIKSLQPVLQNYIQEPHQTINFIFEKKSDKKNSDVGNILPHEFVTEEEISNHNFNSLMINTNGLLLGHELSISIQEKSTNTKGIYLRIIAKGKKEFVKKIKNYYEGLMHDSTSYDVLFFGP